MRRKSEQTGCPSGIADMHTHSLYSHDSRAPLSAMRERMTALGLDFAVTDHFDNEFYDGRDPFSPLLAAAREAEALNATEGAHIAHGVEIGEAIWDRERAARVISLCAHDVVIGSVHAVRYRDRREPFSLIDFSQFPRAEIGDYLAQYFDDLLETVETTDCDIAAHLTVPLRYVAGRYGIPVSLERYEPTVTEILRTLIRRDIALEVNTSCIGSAYDALLPDERIIRAYRALGGEAITLGSDAHRPEDAGHEFPAAIGILREIGYRRVYRFSGRKPIACPI